MRRLIALCTLLACLAPALAAPAQIEQHLPQARLAGKGTFTWFTLPVYDAELWVGPQGYQGTSAPFVLELRYARKLDGVKIAEASAEQMEKIGAGTPAQRQAWLARMKTLFPDVQAGTRISGVYLPGGGATFYLDGRLLGAVPDAEFARAFFGIWLDPATTAGKLRTALLKDAAPR